MEEKPRVSEKLLKHVKILTGFQEIEKALKNMKAKNKNLTTLDEFIDENYASWHKDTG